VRLAGVVRKDEWGRGSGVPSERQLAPPELQLLPALKALPSLASMACNLASIAMGGQASAALPLHLRLRRLRRLQTARLGAVVGLQHPWA
jgi:hypothetical protein